jgi:hypothetical protein
MGRTRRVAAFATTAATAAAALAFAIGAGSAVTQVDPGSRAIEYLQARQSASDGSIPSGSSTNAVSEAYAIGAAAAGYDPNALRHGGGPSVMAYLAAHAASACALAGPCGQLIQAVVAAGLNPGAFGGVNLLTSLGHFYDSSSGAFGTVSAFTQALAVQGLVAASQPVPAAALHLLVIRQDSDGGWGYLLAKDNPNAPSDTNSTAMVLMALDAAGIHTRDAGALAWLHTQQDSDGGFPYQAGFGTDPDSTALVIQALLAAGQNPNAPAWTIAGHTPLAELIASQQPDGGFAFPGNPGSDPFTTAQVPPALDRTGYPLRCATPACFAPGTVLTGPPPSPTPRPTATPRPTSAGVVTPSPPGITATPSPTASVQGVTATPTPAPTTPASTPSANTPAPSGPGNGSTPASIAATGMPTAAVYLLAALGAAVLVAGIAVGVRRLRRA